MKITESLIREVVTKSLARLKSKNLTEAFRLESDFKPGARVTWNTIEKVVKTTASGNKKADHERVAHVGEVKELIPGAGKKAGIAVVLDTDGNTHELETSELTLA